jgi:hypothetical protein
MEPEGLLPFSQEPLASPYPQPDFNKAVNKIPVKEALLQFPILSVFFNIYLIKFLSLSLP